MITQQQAANTAFEIIGGGIGGARAVGRDAGSQPKQRFDGRGEDEAHPLEAERRELSTVAVLGYN